MCGVLSTAKPAAVVCCLAACLLQELTAADVERFRSDDTISQFFDQLSSTYPELIAPLIAGEDICLCDDPA